MKFKSLSQLVLVACSILIFAACSMQRDTHDLKNTSDQINDNSKHLAKRTDDTERELTEKESLAQSEDALDRLFGRFESSTDLHLTNDENSMVKDSAVAIRALFFQYWKGDFRENKSDLDSRLALSLRLLLNTIADYVPRELQGGQLKFDVNVLNPDRNYKACASLAAMLDEVQPDYVANLKAAGLPQISLYDVIEKALMDRGRLARDEMFPLAAAQVLQRKQEAIYLLQLRQNYLPMLVMGWMTGFQNQPDWSRIVHGVADLAGLGKQKVDLNQFDPEQIKLWTSWLEKAAETRDALKKMGIQPEYNGVMMAFVGSLDFDQAKLLATKVNKQDPLAELRYNFARAYQNIVGTYQGHLAVQKVDSSEFKNF